MAKPVLDKRTADPKQKTVAWSFQLYLPGGKRRAVQISKIDFNTDTKARAEAQRQQDELLSRGTLKGNPAERLYAFGVRFLTNRVSPRTHELVSPTTEYGDLQYWRLYVKPSALGRTPMRKINHSVLQSFVDDLARTGLGIRTRGSMCLKLRVVLMGAMRLGLVNYSDIKRVNWTPLQHIPSAEKAIIEPEQLAAARAQLGELNDFDLNHLRFELWSSTGCRPGEIAALRWRNVEVLPEQGQPGALDGACAVIKIRENVVVGRDKQLTLKPPKTKSGLRDLYLPEHVRPLLARVKAAQLAARKADKLPALQAARLAANPDYWFVCTNQWGTIANPNGLSCFLRQYRDKIGLDGASPYTFRYSAGGQHAAGGDIVATSRMLGHSTPKTTMNAYSPVSADRLARANLEALKRIHGTVPAAAGKPAVSG